MSWDFTFQPSGPVPQPDTEFSGTLDDLIDRLAHMNDEESGQYVLRLMAAISSKILESVDSWEEGAQFVKNLSDTNLGAALVFLAMVRLPFDSPSDQRAKVSLSVMTAALYGYRMGVLHGRGGGSLPPVG